MNDHTINFNITGYGIEASMEINKQITAFLDENWTLSIWSSILYVICIFGGRKIMERYSRFDLTVMLAIWSGLLAIFSVIGTVRMLPNLYYALKYQSLYDSICTQQWTYLPVVAFWTSLFSISKIIELGDTVFIVLRKQPLIFLHWYHHITVLVYTWFSYMERTSSGRWYITMNYAVHSVMYTYYALKALRIHAPDWIKMCITLFQLSQMVVGVSIGVYVYNLKKVDTPCGITDRNMYLSFLMYFSYFLLFVKFFYYAYINPPKRAPRRTEGKEVANGRPIVKDISNGYHINGESKKHM